MDAAGERTRFVIKPVSATNAWGVMGLEKLDVSRWRDVLTGQVHTVGDILILLDEPMQRYNFPDKWLLEELLTPPSGQAGVLEEFKVYGFRGRCPLVLQVRGMRDGRGYKWWTADWTPVTTGKYVDRTDPDLQPPECASELVALAEQVSSHIPASFCRIDMFVTDTGVRLSELTPEPGAYHDFSVETDRLLGVYWEQAETRLMTDMKPADLPWTPKT